MTMNTIWYDYDMLWDMCKLMYKDKFMKIYCDDLSASPIVQFSIMSWISYGYVLMRLPYLDVAVLGSLDRHDM